MERSTPQPAAQTSAVTPYLSRDHEDYLDWLENQRRDRTKRSRGHRVVSGFTAFVLTAFAFTGTLLRRR